MDSGDEDMPPLLVDTAELERISTSPRESDEFGKSPVRVPITIVTGYLGAGKTTLMNYILSENHGKKIAVILNEFGDSVDIEKSLTVNKDGEEVQEWLEVGNGCICCSVRDSGVNAIESLMEKKGTFDYILLETTGLADPGNLAPLFWVDEGLGSSIYLDGIVTLVDAKNILRSLDEPATSEVHLDEHGPVMTTAHLQISHADIIVLNKSDLVSAEDLHRVTERIQAINGLATLQVAQHGRVPNLEGFLLDLHAYDHVGKLDVAKKGHSHLDPTMSTVAIEIPALLPQKLQRLDEWLRSILWERQLPLASSDTSRRQPNPFDIHRLKARLNMTDGTVKIVQGVRDVFDILNGGIEDKDDSTPGGKIVLIGRYLDGLDFRGSYLDTISM